MGAGSSRVAPTPSTDLNFQLLRDGVRVAFPLRENVRVPPDATVWQPVPEFPDALLVSLSTQAVLRTLADGSVWDLVGYPADGGDGPVQWRVVLGEQTRTGPCAASPTRRRCRRCSFSARRPDSRPSP